MDQSEYLDQSTGKCKRFDPKNGRMLIVNVDDSNMFEHYRNNHCFKGNVYADYCDYCAREACLYFKPQVNLVPENTGQIVIMQEDDVKRMNGQV